MGLVRKRLLAVAAVATGLAIPAACLPAPTTAVMGRALSAAEKDTVLRMTMRSGGLPGMQTVVVKHGRVVWMKSYGYAVLDQPGPRRPMRNDSIMFSASVGKLLVTVAALQQIERGRFSLDDDINGFVSFAVRNPAWPDVPITWRMLLTHTSSLNEESDERSSSTLTYGTDPAQSLEDVVREALAPGGTRHFPGQWRPGRPGTERIYSNDGFSLAGLALQSVVHEPLDRYIDHAILAPLGMKDTSYWLRGLPRDRLVVGYASLRQRDGGYLFEPALSYWTRAAPGGTPLSHQMTCSDYPSGCAHISARDFARLMLMLMNGGSLNGAEVLKPSSTALMMTPSGFRNADGWNQGLGLNGPLGLLGQQLWGHDGSDRGAATAFYMDPKAGVGAIAFANGNDPDFALAYRTDNIAAQLIHWFE